MAAKKRKSNKGCLIPILVLVAISAVVAAVESILEAIAADPSKFIIAGVLVAALAAAAYAYRRRQAKEEEELKKAQAAERAAAEQARENQRALEAARRQIEREEREAAELAAFEALRASIPLVPARVAEVPAKRGVIADHTFSRITMKTHRSAVSNFVVIDVETTGLKVSDSEIVEVAAVRFADFEPVERFETLCAPRRVIKPEAAAVNGITEEMVAGQPTFQQIAGSLQDFIGDSNVVGHNLGFDLKFLESYGVDFGDGKRKYFDTLALSRTAWPYAVNYKLQTLCRGLDITNAAGHRSLGDALATGLLFERIVEKRIGEGA